MSKSQYINPESKISIRKIISLNNFNSYCIEKRLISVLCLIGLHINGSISDEKLMGQFKTYDKKVIYRTPYNAYESYNLERRVNTHYCELTNTWYSDEIITDIWIDTYYKLNGCDEVPISRLITYLNRLLNKNESYCINYLFYNIIEPILLYLRDHLSKDPFNSDYLKFYEMFYSISKLDIECEYDPNRFKIDSSKHHRVDGYCCEDCDGPYEASVANAVEYYVESKINDIRDIMIKSLNSIKRYKSKIII